MKASIPPQVLGIASPKGGVAKSSLAVQLACHWARRHRLLLVDGDPNRSAIGFHQRGAHRWVAVPPDAAAAAIAQGRPSLVIADTAGGHRGGLAELAGSATFLLAPCPPSPAAVAATLAAAPTITAVTDRWAVVLTMADARRPGDTAAARELLRSAGLPVLEAHTTRLSVWEKAELAGCALADVRGSPSRMVAHGQLLAICAELPFPATT